MELVSHADAAAFAAAARPIYDADPERHTLALTVLDALVRTGARPAAALTMHADGGGAVAALVGTAERPAIVSGVPARHAPAFAGALAGSGLGGCSGPAAEAEAFAAAWAARTGAAARVELLLRLFVLDTLLPPAGVPGAARRVGADRPDAVDPAADPADPADDVAVLAAMREAFAVEEERAWVASRTPEQTVRAALELGYGELLWEVEGTPVAQASARAPVAGMSRIGPVYTVPAHRGRGYAAAVTAAAARWAIDAGAERVLLFTDAANATTDRLYPRLGFRYRGGSVDVSFTSP